MNGQVDNRPPCNRPDRRPSTPVYFYGCGLFKPRWLQKFMNNAKAFLVLLTLANIMQGITVNGLLKVNVTSIERRFNLLSSESGLIISAYDIAGCLSLLPISYLGGRGHKPRWIGIGLIVTSLGTMMLALPHFLTGPYVYRSIGTGLLGNDSNTTSNLCQPSRTALLQVNSSEEASLDEQCLKETTSSGSYFSLNQMKYVFLVGQFVIGIGSTPLAVLSVTFIDESVDPPVYPLYISIYYMGALVGPALGFILGSQLLNLFTEIGVTPQDLTPDSFQWVGAWWLGFVISSVVMFLLAIPVLAYPRSLPSTLTRKITLVDIKGQYCHPGTIPTAHLATADGRKFCQINRDDRIHSAEEQTTPLHTSMPVEGPITSEDRADDSPGHERNAQPSNKCEIVYKFFTDLVVVMTNKAFIFLSVAAAVIGTLVSGFSTFGPKFIESQFNKSASDAANLFGYVCIPAGAGGMLVGSFMMSGLKLSHTSSLRMCFCVSIVGLFALFALTLHCDDIPLAGVTVPYANRRGGDEGLTSSCNRMCACSPDLFDPVCGADDVTYYSPCFASCTSANVTSAKLYTNCSCLSPSLPRSNGSLSTGPSTLKNADEGSASGGKCVAECRWRDVILVGLFLVISSTFVCAVPGADLSLRCFPQELRSLSVGVQWILIRTLGTIPGPIVFGAMIDSTCLVWSKQERCAEGVGACVVYKNQELSFTLLILSVIFKGASILFFGLALGTYKPARLAEAESPTRGGREVVESPL